MRISRIKWENPDNSTTPSSLMGLFDEHIMAVYRITNEEYDLLAESMTDEEIGIMVKEHPTFSQKREIMLLIPN